ncbi:hypothetical protein BN136_2931 [Cronobacter universalis NCTC 9529]|nr:hypothetical protein BN136_2931 [Cronobacter universalis NCTC 9529]
MSRQSRGGTGVGALAAPMVRQAQERHRAAARNDLSAGKPAGRYRCQQQGRRRRCRLAGAGQRSSRLRLPHRHGDGARRRPGRGRREAAHGGARYPRPGLRDDPRNPQRGRCLAVVRPRQRIRERASSHRFDAEPGAHDADVSGMGRAEEERPPRRPAADRDTHRWCDAVPAGNAHRRRGPHPCRRADWHGQVGAARHPGHAVPALLRLADLRLRHGALDARHHPRPWR